MKINELLTEATKQRLDAKCWKGKHKEGTKMKGGVRVNNCVPNESIKEGSMKDQMHKDAERMSREKFVDKYGDENGEFWDNIMGDLDESVKKGLYYNVNKRKKAGTSRDASSPKAPTAQAWKDAAKTAKKEGVAEGEQRMSRAAKGHEKYGKAGMAALAKAGRDGAGEEKLDKIRDKYDKYDESAPNLKGHDTKYGVVVVGHNDGKPVKTFNNEADAKAFADKGIRVDGGLKQGSVRTIVAPKKKTNETSVDELARVLELSGLNLTADEQFDIIEDMVESLALEHGVDAEVIWEDFESVDDDELLESAAWRNKSGKSKTGGLNAKGVASYRRENPGSKLQTAVTTKPSKLKKGSKAAKRRKSFCARMGGVKGPMKKPNGKPTRKALALRKWNC